MSSVYQRLREDIAAIIGVEVDRIQPADNLVDLGLDSLSLMELLLTLERRHNIRIEMTDVFEGPTVEALASAVTRLSGKEE